MISAVSMTSVLRFPEAALPERLGPPATLVGGEPTVVEAVMLVGYFVML
jgi:hypothetical protein